MYDRLIQCIRDNEDDNANLLQKLLDVGIKLVKNTSDKCLLFTGHKTMCKCQNEALISLEINIRTRCL